MQQHAPVAPCLGNRHALQVQAVRLAREGVPDYLGDVLLRELQNLLCNRSRSGGALSNFERLALFQAPDLLDDKLPLTLNLLEKLNLLSLGRDSREALS